jgi:hypothetical protein
MPPRVHPSASIASGKTPGNWLGSIASLATVLQSGIASQPAADGGRRLR